MSNFGWSDRNHLCGRFDIIQSAEFLDMDVYYIDIDYHNISNNYDQIKWLGSQNNYVL